MATALTEQQELRILPPAESLHRRNDNGWADDDEQPAYDTQPSIMEGYEQEDANDEAEEEENSCPVNAMIPPHAAGIIRRCSEPPEKSRPTTFVVDDVCQWITIPLD